MNKVHTHLGSTPLSNKHLSFHRHTHPPKKEDIFVLYMQFGVYTVLLLCAILLATEQFFQHKYTGKFFPGSYINGYALEGKTTTEVVHYFQDINNKILSSSIILTHDDEIVATTSGKLLHVVFPIDAPIQRAYSIGRSGSLVQKTLDTMSIVFGGKKTDISVIPEVDATELEKLIHHIQTELTVAPINAAFEEKDGKVTKLIMEKDGQEIDTQTVITNVQNFFTHISDLKPIMTIPLTTTVVKAPILLKDINPYGVEELIGMGQSNYTHSSANRIFNLSLATKRINGSIIKQGEIGSFNAMVGEITGETGYKEGYIIRNGKTELDDGGGVCQTSTTFFRGAMNVGLPILERHAHAYRVGYYENDAKAGLDATIYSPTVDLKIKNDTPAAIIVMTENDTKNLILRYYFYGKSDGRKSSITEPVIYDKVPAPPSIYEDDPTLKKGTTKQIESAVAGAKSKFDYTVTRNGETIYAKNFLSVYKAWPAVYKVGTAE